MRFASAFGSLFLFCCCFHQAFLKLFKMFNLFVLLLMKFDILASFLCMLCPLLQNIFCPSVCFSFPKDLIILADFSIRRSACAFSLRCFAKMDSCSWIDSDSLPNSRLNFASCACLLSQSFCCLDFSNHQRDIGLSQCFF